MRPVSTNPQSNPLQSSNLDNNPSGIPPAGNSTNNGAGGSPRAQRASAASVLTQKRDDNNDLRSGSFTVPALSPQQQAEEIESTF